MKRRTEERSGRVRKESSSGGIRKRKAKINKQEKDEERKDHRNRMGR